MLMLKRSSIPGFIVFFTYLWDLKKFLNCGEFIEFLWEKLWETSVTCILMPFVMWDKFLN